MPKQTENNFSEYTLRSAPVAAPNSFNRDNSSVEFIASTQEPAIVFDWMRGYIREILFSDGIQIPKNGQVPLQDSHDASSVAKTIGSFREIRVEQGSQGPQLVGRAYFARDEFSQSVAQKVQDGHITDGSVRYSPISSIWVPEGEVRNYKGVDYKGPIKLTTKSLLREFSPTPIGADPNAKARSEALALASANESPETKPEPETETNPSRCALESESQKFNAEENTVPKPNDQVVETPNSAPAADLKKIEADASARAIAEYKQRVAKINQCARALNLESEAQAWIDSDMSIEQVRDAALAMAEKQNQPVSVRAEITEDAADKFRAAAVDAILIGNGVKVEKPAAGAEQLSRLGFEGLAREALCLRGENTRSMSRIQLLTKAMERGFVGMSSADFPYILSTSANKLALAGWNQQPSTILAWASTANIRDFKMNDRVRLSDVAALTKTMANAEIKRSSLAETREQYAIYTYGAILPITRAMLINDDLGEFKKLYLGFGMAAKATVNQVGYAILSANAALSDTLALFHATHLNLAGVGAAPSATTVSAGRAAMRAQTGPKGTKLNLPVAYLICGPTMEENALIVLTSDTLPVAGMGSGVTNPYKNSSQVVVDAEITGNEWYLATNPNLNPTIEMGFLEGIQSPTIETLPASNDILGMDLRCYIDFGGKALDFRGLYKNPGAA